MTPTIPRLDLAAHAAAPLAAMLRLEERITFDDGLRELVKLRVSQINGCLYCVDLHHTEARARGENEMRLVHLAAWHESPLFDARERAALSLAESVTHVATTRVPDDVWAEAERHLGAGELANLLFVIAAINGWNRLAVSARTPPRSAASASASSP